MKKTIVLLMAIPLFYGCGSLEEVISQFPQSTQNGIISNTDIASGLKEALNNGITKQVTKLTATDGFYKNEAVKILLPEELKKVDSALRKVGLGSLADEGLKYMNRAAEDAVKEATPIFVDAIKGMSFTDAKNILLGNNNAATTYLQSSTTSALTAKFSPIIQNSYTKVGADKIWTEIITKYNTIPLVQKVNPDLTAYTTQKAMDGVFKMIAVEEQNIRTNITSRSSTLLQKVFALQDKK
nr:DUF4197 domain-containing protein [uncultured Flavobacterium sp.]